MIIEKIDVLRSYLKEKRKSNLTVGLVPTMGWLHEGHLSLIRKAKSENDIVVVSVFVNPTQFAPGEDFAAYPRDIGRDCALATKAGADIVFHPGDGEIYPGGSSTFVAVEGGMTNVLCGVSRPAHFKGVTTVVNMLFNIVGADRAYFGQKDAQQAALVAKMVNDLHIDIEVVVCPIVRDENGLALSSRNKYLSDDEKRQALILGQALRLAQKAIGEGQRDSLSIVRMIKEKIDEKPLAQIDYVGVYTYPALEPADQIEGKTLIALAVKFGETRLIDNIIIQ